MRLYGGCDLHAKSNYWGIVDGEGKRVFKKKVGNDGERILGVLEGNEDLALAGQVSKEVIDYLRGKIEEVEKAIIGRAEIRESVGGLLTLPGVGKVLGLTIRLETGPISRFGEVGNYVSYCRKVPSRWCSAGKVKGQGNRKNGNRYLSWAFSEAAELARRFHAEPRAYYQRKMGQTNAAVAHSALAHKLARVAYYILRDGVRYDPEKLFGLNRAGAESLKGGLAKNHET